MNRLLLQPASGKDASEHYDSTIDKGVSIEYLADYLPGPDTAKLKSLKQNKIKVWGFIPRPDGSAPGPWTELKENDGVVFYKKGSLYFFGKVIHKYHQPALAKALWGQNLDGRTWEFIYFLKEGKQIDVPFNPKILGYKDNFVPQGTLLLREDQSVALTDYLLQYEKSLVDEDQVELTVTEEADMSSKYAPPVDPEEALKKIQQIGAEMGSKPVVERIKIAKYLARNPKYSRLVKEHSNYCCEVCGAKPFTQKNGMFFAEAHHLDELAVSKLDNPVRMICVCPTCHRVIHYGNDAALTERKIKAA